MGGTHGSGAVTGWCYADGRGKGAVVRRSGESFDLRVCGVGGPARRGPYGTREEAVSALMGMHPGMREAGCEVDFHGALEELVAGGMTAVEASREMGIDNCG